MQTTMLLLLVFLHTACSKKAEAPAGGSAAGGSTAASTGSTTAGTTGSTTGSGAGSATAGAGSGSGATAGSAATPSGSGAAGGATCAGGDAAACVAEARAIAPTGAFRVKLSKEDADRKVEATTKLASRACELGAGEGCALMAQYGKFADSDKNLARACELGYVPSCGSIGRGLVDRGKDRQRAAELLEKACEAAAFDWKALTSHAGGFCHVLYELYKGPLKNKDKAAKALERACAQGDKRDCACKTDADCGEVPEDMSGSYECSGGKCDITGGG